MLPLKSQGDMPIGGNIDSLKQGIYGYNKDSGHPQDYFPTPYGIVIMIDPKAIANGGYPKACLYISSAGNIHLKTFWGSTWSEWIKVL